MTESLPCSRVTTLPDTGASTISAPFSRTLAARARLTAGLTVLMSISTFPAPMPASNPSAPYATSSTAEEFVTITKVRSAAWHTARGESAHFMPLSINHCAFDRVAVYPVTVCPFSISLRAFDRPLRPGLHSQDSPSC